MDKRYQQLKKGNGYTQGEAQVFTGARLKKQLDMTRKGDQVKDLVNDWKGGEIYMLQANIEKEEIHRALKHKEQNGTPGGPSVRELKNLAERRESVKQKEMQLINNVNLLDQQINDQQNYFQNEAINAESLAPNMKSKALQIIEQKEREFMAQKADMTQKIQRERENIERQRDDIMSKIDRRIASGKSGNGYRNNNSARKLGTQLMHGNGGIEPSLQDKLIRDQERINQLRNQQNQPVQFEGGSEYQSSPQKAPQHIPQYQQQEMPSTTYNLGMIKNKLQTEQPTKMNYQMPLQQNPNMMAQLDDLENLLLGPSQKPAAPFPQTSFETGGSTMVAPQAPQNNQAQFQNSNIMPAYQMNMNQPQQYYQGALPMQNLQQPFDRQQQQPVMSGMYPTNPGIGLMQNMIKKQEEETKQIIEQLGNMAHAPNDITESPGPQYKGPKFQVGPEQHLQTFQTDATRASQEAYFDNNTVPDDFVFRQNEQRGNDLEVEERALMNIQAQEYDALRLIQKLPKDSDLYQIKFQNYRQVSEMRAEIEKVLQEQRLDKIKREFEKQKIDDDRENKHNLWLENQKQTILQEKLNQNINQQMKQYHEQHQHDPSGYDEMVQPRSGQSHYDQVEQKRSRQQSSPAGQYEKQPSSYHAPSQNEQSLKKAKSSSKPSKVRSDDFTPFMLTVDQVSGIPDQFKQLKIDFTEFQERNAVGDTERLGPFKVSTDPSNKHIKKSVFGTSHPFNQTKLDQRCQIIIEVIGVESNGKERGLGWTWVFPYSENPLDVDDGKWLLPMYQGTAQPKQSFTTPNIIKTAPNVNICIKIGLEGSAQITEKVSLKQKIAEYEQPPYHFQDPKLLKQNEPDRESPPRQRQQTQQQQKLTDSNKNRDPRYTSPTNGTTSSEGDSPSSPESPSSPDSPKGKPVINPRYRNTGLRVRLHYFSSVKNWEKFSIRVVATEGHKNCIGDDKNELNQTSPAFPDKQFVQAKQGQVITYDKNGSVKVGARAQGTEGGQSIFQNCFHRDLEDYEIVFKKDLYTPFFDQDKVFILRVDIFARPAGSTSQPRQIGFVERRLNKDNGTINFGRNHLQMIQVPTQDLTLDYLGIEILDPQVVKQTLKNRRPTSAISNQYILNDKAQYNLFQEVNPEDNLIVYIDGTRFLPDNCSLTKVIVRVVDLNVKQQFPTFEKQAALSGSFRNQTYGIKMPIPMKKLMPSTILYMTFLTFDQDTNQPQVIGYSQFPLFIDVAKKQPCETNYQSKKQKIAPHTGCYQLPIVQGKIDESYPFNIEKFIYHDKLPTTSILIRIKTDGEEISKGEDRIPNYQKGAYCTKYFNPHENEIEIMKARRNETIAVPIEKIMKLFLEQNGIDFNDKDPSRLLAFFDNILKHDDQTPMIDMNYFSQYKANLGFNFGVEAIHNNEKKGFFSVLATTVPFASYYDKKRTEAPTDSFIFFKPDYESKTISFRFDEGTIRIRNLDADRTGLSMIVDIKIYIPDDDMFYDFGYAVVPIVSDYETDGDTSTQEWYVNSGVFTLPIYEGKIQQNVIDMLLLSDDPVGIMENCCKQNIIKRMDKTTVIVRIVDEQRKMHFRKELDKEEPSSRYIDQKSIKQLAYKRMEGGFFVKKYSQLVPKKWNNDFNAFSTYLKESFRNWMNIKQTDTEAAKELKLLQARDMADLTAEELKKVWQASTGQSDAQFKSRMGGQMSVVESNLAVIKE